MASPMRVIRTCRAGIRSGPWIDGGPLSWFASQTIAGQRIPL